MFSYDHWRHLSKTRETEVDALALCERVTLVRADPVFPCRSLIIMIIIIITMMIMMIMMIMIIHMIMLLIMIVRVILMRMVSTKPIMKRVTARLN